MILVLQFFSLHIESLQPKVVLEKHPEKPPEKSKERRGRKCATWSGVNSKYNTYVYDLKPDIMLIINQRNMGPPYHYLFFYFQDLHFERIWIRILFLLSMR